MFDTLFTIAMTASAAAAIAFLLYALAGYPARAPDCRCRSLVAGSPSSSRSARRGCSVRPAGTPALGLAVVAPVATLVVLFALVHSICNAALAVPLPALVAINSIRVLGLFFVALFAQGGFRRPLLRRQAGAISRSASPLSRWPGSLRGSGGGCARSRSCGIHSDSWTSSTQLHLGSCRRRAPFRSLSDRRPAR